MTDWREKLKLEDGQNIKHINHRAKGPLAETDIDEYNVMQGDQVIGSVTVTDHTNIKAPFLRSISVIQRDESGTVVVEEYWNPS